MTMSVNELYDRALALSSEAEDTFLDLGRSLRQSLDRDPGLFQQIAKKGRLGRRKVVEVSRKFEPLPISRARLKEIGWTKLQIIGQHVTKDNVQGLVSLAEKLKAKQLEREMHGGEPLGDDQMVADGRMPAAKLINSRRVWMRSKIEKAFAELPEDGQGKEPANPWQNCA